MHSKLLAYVNEHIDPALLDLSITNQSNATLIYHNTAKYVPATNMPLKCHIYVTGQWGCWMNWWAHQSSNLSCMHKFAPKGCSLCPYDTVSEGYKAANYPVNLQTTKWTPTKGTQDNLGYMPLNK